MDRLQEEPMRYHPLEASVTQIAATDKFPPSVCATGNALHLRCWKSIGDGDSDELDPGFHPKLDYPPLNNAGSRVVHVAMEGGVLLAVEGDKRGHVTVWDAETFEHIHSFDALSEEEAKGLAHPYGVSSVAFDGDHLALGLATGRCGVYRRGLESKDDLHYRELMQPLPIDIGTPVTAVQIDEQGLLVVHAHSKKQTGCWRLADGKLVNAWGEPDPRVRAMPLVHSMCVGGLFLGVHWKEGSQMVMTMVQAVQRQGGQINIGDHAEAVSTSRPMSANFDGRQLVVGMENGTVCAWGIADGFEPWGGHHNGAVTAVRCVPGNAARAVTGGCDSTVKLWGPSGELLARVDMRSQVTAITVRGRLALVGSARGEVEPVVLPEEDGAGAPTLVDEVHPGGGPPLERHFDAGQGCRGSALNHAAQFAGAFPSFEPASATEEVINAPAPEKKQDATPAPKDPNAPRDPSEMTEHEKSAAMDLPGVARDPDAAPLRVLGRKCGNATCLVREGDSTDKFKRCGGCKSRFYCSAHCQRTHWRDGHAKECKALAAKLAASGEQEGTGE